MAILGFGNLFNGITSKLFVVNKMNEDIFCEIFLNNLYDRILRNLYDRTLFNKDFETSTMLDCPLVNAQNKGFITLLRKALVSNSKLSLKYDKISDTILPLTTAYKGEDYTCSIDFCYLKNLNIALLYYAKSMYMLSKSLNVKILNSSALIIYLNGLTDSVAKNQIEAVNKQVKSLIDSINTGEAGVLDKDSKIESGIVDVAGISEGQEYIMRQISLLLKYSVNFLTGESTAGMGSTGEQDQEKDFKSLSISFSEFWKPTIEKLYNTKIVLKIDKWQLSDTHRSFLDWIETNSLLPITVKKEIVATILESNGLIDKKQAEEIKNFEPINNFNGINNDEQDNI